MTMMMMTILVVDRGSDSSTQYRPLVLWWACQSGFRWQQLSFWCVWLGRRSAESTEFRHSLCRLETAPLSSPFYCRYKRQRLKNNYKLHGRIELLRPLCMNCLFLSRSLLTGQTYSSALYTQLIPVTCSSVTPPHLVLYHMYIDETETKQKKTYVGLRYKLCIASNKLMSYNKDG